MDYKKIAEDVSTTLFAYFQDSADWKVVKRTKFIEVSSKPSLCFEGNIYRAEALVEIPVNKLFPFIYLPEYRSKWDKAVQSYKLVETVDQDTFIFHSITHSYGFGLISPRDFVYIVHIKKYDDGNLMTTNSVSVDHPDYLPTPRYVRGSNFPSGYACSPHPENPDHSKLVAILQVDLGGMLMPSLVDSVMPMTLINLVTDCKSGFKSLKETIP
ncbi:stAR-related lipid transfer protein 6 [Varanus komodoensis]|uniref:stAR-related lipid transfer protein 6 n=1 Tax=Varanus komodoensis TaxID=61221 RepID=UPI001CF7DCC7|nr:stAR-related lipid transfer protein 6 [Varanus komodoensis]